MAVAVELGHKPVAQRAVDILVDFAQRSGLSPLVAWIEANRDAVAGLLTQKFGAYWADNAKLRIVEAPVEQGPVDWTNLPEPRDTELQSAAKRRDANIVALRTLKDLNGRPAQGAERDALAGYSGWGGVIATVRDIKALPDDVRPSDDGRGTLDEYFTPARFAHDCWRLLARLRADGMIPEIPAVLEPSAGIGRFMSTAPKGLHFNAVELSDQSAALLRALFPGSRVYEGSFQEFMRDNPPPRNGDYDIVIANPPYVSQGQYQHTDRATAHKGKLWQKNEHYFLHAASRRLRPGGVMVFLVPLGVLMGTAHKRIREALLLECHFLGGWVMPNKLFPGANLGLCACVWRKRPERLAEVLPEDREVLRGDYFQGEGKDHITGRWMSKEAGDWRSGAEDYDPEAFVNMRLRPQPANMARLRVEGAPLPSIPPGPPEDAPEATAWDSEAAAVGEALGRRIETFRLLRSQNPDMAAEAQPELRADIYAYMARFGNPHERKDIDTKRRYHLALLSVILPDGELAPILSEPLVSQRVQKGYSGDPTDLDAIVQYLSHDLGAGPVTWSDVMRLYKGPPDLATALSLLEDGHEVAVELTDPEPETQEDKDADHRGRVKLMDKFMARVRLYAMRQYLTGNLYDRLDRLDASVSWSLLREFFDRQRKLLIDTIDPLTADSIDIDIRQSQDLPGRPAPVPVECVGEYLTEINRGEPVAAVWEDGYFNFETQSVKDTDVYQIAAFINNDKTIQETGAVNLNAKKDDLLRKKSSRYSKKWTKRSEGRMTLEEKLEYDKQIVEKFAHWVRESEKWAPIVADRYNRATRGERRRAVPNDPLPLARWTPDPERQLRDFQNEAIRLVTDQRGGILAHEPGLGKTSEALGIVAWWRQIGLSKRALIVVPKQVLPNWVIEARKFLPDFRVCPIGVTEKTRADGTTYWSEDSDPSVRTRKWGEFAAGLYDVAICTQPNFQDITVRPDTRKFLLQKVLWLMRQVEGDKRKRKKLAERKKHLQDLLELAEGSYRFDEQGIAKIEEELEKAEISYLKEVDEEKGLVAEIEKIRRDLRDMEDAGEEHSKKYAKLEKSLAKKEEKLANISDEDESLRMLADAAQDAAAWENNREFRRRPKTGIWWEELDVDLLIVDEAHNYKNLFKPAARYGKTVKYLGAGEDKTADDVCKSCWDLWLKSTYLRSRYDGTGVVLLTGTVVTNSPLELYNALQYVRPEVFEARGIPHKEAFLEKYCEFTTQITGAAQGGTKEAIAVTAFRNLNELRVILDLLVHFKSALDVGLPIPDSESVTVECPMTPEQEEAYETLREIGEKVRRASAGGGNAKSAAVDDDEAVDSNDKEDLPSLFEILHEMDDASIDLRLEANLRPPFPGWNKSPKYENLIERIKEQADCGHIVFVNRAKIIPYLKKAFKAAGIKDVAEITGATKLDKRQAVMDAFNGKYETDGQGNERMVAEPSINVVIGTNAMQEGVNLQRRACAVHHLQIPWTPAAVAQRNGRAVRQGNQWAKQANMPVKLYYYITERSFDWFKMAAVMGKLGWIDTLVRSKGNTAANPMAESDWDEETLIRVFATDPEKAAEEMKKAKEAAQQKRREYWLKEGQKRIDYYATLWSNSRRERRPEFADRIRRQARAAAERIAAIPDDILAPGEKQRIVERASERDILYRMTSGSFIEAGAPATQNGERYWIHSANPRSGLYTYRPFGTLTLHEEFYRDLDRYGRTASNMTSADMDWDHASDVDKALASLGKWNLASLRSFAPFAYGKHWPYVWAKMDPGYLKDDWLIPFEGPDGRLELTLLEATPYWTKRQSPKDVPIPPTEEGWRLFQSLEGQKLKDRAKVVRQWFGGYYQGTTASAG